MAELMVDSVDLVLRLTPVVLATALRSRVHPPLQAIVPPHVTPTTLDTAADVRWHGLSRWCTRRTGHRDDVQVFVAPHPGHRRPEHPAGDHRLCEARGLYPGASRAAVDLNAALARSRRDALTGSAVDLTSGWKSPADTLSRPAHQAAAAVVLLSPGSDRSTVMPTTDGSPAGSAATSPTRARCKALPPHATTTTASAPPARATCSPSCTTTVPAPPRLHMARRQTSDPAPSCSSAGTAKDPSQSCSEPITRPHQGADHGPADPQDRRDPAPMHQEVAPGPGPQRIRPRFVPRCPGLLVMTSSSSDHDRTGPCRADRRLRHRGRPVLDALAAGQWTAHLRGFRGGSSSWVLAGSARLSKRMTDA